MRGGEYDILKRSHPFEVKDANTIRFEIAVPAGQEVVVTYTARVRSSAGSAGVERNRRRVGESGVLRERAYSLNPSRRRSCWNLGCARSGSMAGSTLMKTTSSICASIACSS